MDIENTQSNNPPDNLHKTIQIRKKGRPKKIVEVTEQVFEVKEEKKNKKTSNMKEYRKQKYLENKDKAKESAIESQKRYREAYKLLVQMIEKNFNISQEIKDQVVKIVSV